MISNEYYEIRYDSVKNRFYFKIKGFWKSADLVPHYLEDWKKMAGKAKPGFTVLTDLRETKAQTDEVIKIHQEAQKYVLKKGLRKVAEVVDKAIIKLSVGTISKASGMESLKQTFDNVEKAEKWLDT